MSEYIYRRERVSDGVWSAENTGEEIVRCRDCYFADEIEGGYWCDRFTCGKEPVTPNGYCKWGDRK
ncbi:MAG: hypothetical protein IKF14_05180 [Atopobiaceae bacterium]|nr:hypothetical protein [Atopobiaceae bacterium]MBR3158482.1 hypothetical protein [Atopobiaceae bacterium]